MTKQEVFSHGLCVGFAEGPKVGPLPLADLVNLSLEKAKIQNLASLCDSIVEAEKLTLVWAKGYRSGHRQQIAGRPFLPIQTKG